LHRILALEVARGQSPSAVRYSQSSRREVDSQNLPPSSHLDDIRKKLAKPPGWTVPSMAEALKPEHGLETLAILKSWAASAVCFSGGDGIRL
jgi:hypothetical protein